MARETKYIQGTIGLPLILSIDKSGNIKLYVDTEFVVHKDMRSHTGGFTTMWTWRTYVQFNQNNLTLKFHLWPSLLGWTMSWQRWSGTDTSWKSRDTISMEILSIKIIRVSSNWRRMVDNQVTSVLATSISDIISSLIQSQSRNHIWNSISPWTWLGISSQKHYKDLNFVLLVISSLVSTKMTFPPKMHP